MLKVSIDKREAVLLDIIYEISIINFDFYFKE